LCVGDIADQAGRYESLGGRVYWIHGNNDNFDAIAAGDLPRDLHHLENASLVEIPLSPEPRSEPPGRHAQLRVVGLGGTFAPTMYETPAAELPHPKKGTAKATEMADKRRHFVREQVEACKALREVDVFLTHEAPKPFRPFAGGRGPDAGKAQINEVLAAIQPRLHLFGHHHRFTDQIYEGVRSIGLDLVSKSYILINAATFDVEMMS
jgi:Icc-related predicted phosphoesterase